MDREKRAGISLLPCTNYKFVVNPKHAAKMLDELKRLRIKQEILLHCFVWEPEGELEKKQIPQELWDPIE